MSLSPGERRSSGEDQQKHMHNVPKQCAMRHPRLLRDAFEEIE